MKYIIFLFCILLLFAACKPGRHPSVAFYSWRTNAHISPFEKNVLAQNQVKKIYLRCFDVDQKPGEVEPLPVAPVITDSSLSGYQVIPVVFIKNRVFGNTDSVAVQSLAHHVYAKVNGLLKNIPGYTAAGEIQFDCDWTESTAGSYFSFLRYYRSLSSQKLSSTIRLHQVKYLVRTGVPPVDKGVLMYYNMGGINAGNDNSVYDRTKALQYIESLGHYPLPLDLALPVFEWGQLVRNSHVVQLLNKMNATNFTGDTNFIAITSSRFRVKNACFKSGYYFRQDDEVKIESVSEQMLHEIVDDVRKRFNQIPHEVIFYDLDSINFSSYDNKMYQKLVRSFN